MRTLVTWIMLVVGGAATLEAQKPELKDGEGYVSVPGGRLWYRVVGDGPRTPLLVVHGCCGVGSYYLAPLAALADDRIAGLSRLLLRALAGAARPPGCRT